jgi:hypothetical protein
MMLLSPAVETVRLSLDDDDLIFNYIRGVDITLENAARHCKFLRVLEISFPEALQLEVTTSILNHLKPFDYLREIHLDPVDLREGIVRLLGQMPCLEDMCCKTQLLTPHRLPKAFQFTGFKKLRILRLTNRPNSIGTFMKCFDPDNLLEHVWLQDLLNDDDESEGVTLFPKTFVGKHINKLNISSYFEGNTGRNILTSCARFCELRTLILRGRYLPRVSDEDLVQGLQSCHRLRTLSLCEDAQLFVPKLDDIRPTLGCLQPLLATCKSLSEIRGCFDLDQKSIPNALGSPFPQIQSIDLGTSYFVKFPPPHDWIEKTISFLASFFEAACRLSIKDKPCMLVSLPRQTKDNVLKRRKGDKVIFDATVLAFHRSKLRSGIGKNSNLI